MLACLHGLSGFVVKMLTRGLAGCNTEQIEREIGITINCEPSGDEEKERKRQYTDKTQDELIELLLRAQVSLLSFPPLSSFLLALVLASAELEGSLSTSRRV